MDVVAGRLRIAPAAGHQSSSAASRFEPSGAGPGLGACFSPKHSPNDFTTHALTNAQA
jgi:hypothetical protein